MVRGFITCDVRYIRFDYALAALFKRATTSVDVSLNSSIAAAILLSLS
jgi:hypothetical protein